MTMPACLRKAAAYFWPDRVIVLEEPQRRTKSLPLCRLCLDWSRRRPPVYPAVLARHYAGMAWHLGGSANG